ncbi:hypothetical protein COY52_03165 [Candidatus Desantisbacteria bacterium CG_4_10_14_0_8_um_filter_48_22]|uniref:KilA-N DNA-binding domain-containing protein n=1 Tax=Candidatus Desantisbacteria bacterium CG_4_10_14_0_8_um_filter_48_22 TaxID=1974543 RepID=A0A2M7SE31_9BACT|nr:MAG: hypothetical protein COS16_08895 [Candidatus Desantisbacteria bacterium CG02_land_8_20_14_3_00_49_13]PIZ17730.1 MAG: hypothetical protein COY52_03165 [Candidatus Desantisbacteria bacterium CG_4_10_14_0_8_um_filter_48_22]
MGAVPTFNKTYRSRQGRPLGSGRKIFLRCQIVTSNLKCHFDTSSWGGTRKLPYTFTEKGAAMLSVNLWRHRKK